jgi:hypothetical protein
VHIDTGIVVTALVRTVVAFSAAAAKDVVNCLGWLPLLSPLAAATALRSPAFGRSRQPPAASKPQHAAGASQHNPLPHSAELGALMHVSLSFDIRG